MHVGSKLTDKNVPGEVKPTDKDLENSQVHACSFPFTGRFRGAGWNTQSLFAYGQTATQKYTLDLAFKHDFTVCLRQEARLSATQAWDGNSMQNMIISSAIWTSTRVALVSK